MSGRVRWRAEHVHAPETVGDDDRLAVQEGHAMRLPQTGRHTLDHIRQGHMRTATIHCDVDVRNRDRALIAPGERQAVSIRREADVLEASWLAGNSLNRSRSVVRDFHRSCCYRVARGASRSLLNRSLERS